MKETDEKHLKLIKVVNKNLNLLKQMSVTHGVLNSISNAREDGQQPISLVFSENLLKVFPIS